MSKPPLLHQYNFSNYNEKARWALDYKGVPHRRRSLLAGGPRALAFSLRGTVPVLDLDGERIADSTAIIAALERRNPEPALYPADPGLRAQALALEDHFDEEVGHAMRRAYFWEIRDDRDYMADFVTVGQPAAARAFLKTAFPVAWLYISHRYAFNEDDAAAARATLAAALDRIEAERDGGDYLIGDRFSVADLTAAALLWPFAWPPEFQYRIPKPAGFEEIEWLQPLLGHPAADWIAEMFARHRGASAELP